MKTIEESAAMKEIREIRRKQYEETKHMTVAERIAYDKKAVDKFAKITGITLPARKKTK